MVLKVYYENGQIQQECEFKNGIENGKFTEYYENGNIYKDVTFKNGKLNGLFKEYSIDGSINREVYLRDGEEVLEGDKPKSNDEVRKKHNEITDDFLDFFIEKNQEKIKSWFPTLVDNNGNIVDEKEFKQVLKKKLEENGNL